MAGEKQMVLGFNHNVKHKGAPYHVQTEDSGVDNPRIVTHLFVGGNVIASKKTSYADIVGAENLAQVVRELMEEQHKEMLRNLISGVYDDTDQEIAAKAQAFQPGQIVPEPERVAAPRSLPEAAKAPPAKPPPIPRPAPQEPKQELAVKPPPASERRLERAAPPAAPAGAAPRSSRAAPAQRSQPAAAAHAGSGPGRRHEGVEARFGEDLISEKSLDEVILSYLAEDLAEKR